MSPIEETAAEAAAPRMVEALRNIIRADSRAVAMSDYRASPDFAELRRSISEARNVLASIEGK